MLDSINLKKSYAEKYSVNSFVNSSQNKSALPSILKREFPKPIFPSKKKAKRHSEYEGEFNENGRKSLKTKITYNSNGFFKHKRSYLSDDSNDFYEEGDIKRTKMFNVIRKKYKRVRFSDCNDIINGPSYPVYDTPPVNSINSQLLDSESLLEEVLSLDFPPHSYIGILEQNKRNMQSDNCKQFSLSHTHTTITLPR